MIQSSHWRFQVHCPSADEVYLVDRSAAGGTRLWPMCRAAAGHWVLTRPLREEASRFGYYVREGTKLVHHGAAGLLAVRVGADCRQAAVG